MLYRILCCLTVLLVLAGCASGNYFESFEKDDVWSVRERPGLHMTVDAELNEHLELTLDWPQTIFWSTAGRSDLLTGSFEMTGTPIDGDSEVGYGLVFLSNEGAETFYYFMVSTDGFYSLGQCTGHCETTTMEDDTGDRVVLSDPEWIESSAIRTGVGMSNTIRVDAPAPELGKNDAILLINGTEISRTNVTVSDYGDIGFVMQTFGSAATVAFDDLKFTNYEE